MKSKMASWKEIVLMSNEIVDDYVKKIESLRYERQQRMIGNPLSWFALAGLFPLQQGENKFGNQADSKIQIPQLMDEMSGSLILNSGKVFLQNLTSTKITLNGEAAHDQPLRSDVDGNPDLIEAGSIAMRVIARGGRFFLRVWDRQSPQVANFNGLNFFQVNPAFRLVAQFMPFDSPLMLKKVDVIGTEYDQPFIGSAKFTVGGKECSLIAEEDEDELLFSFTDETRRDSTYPGGRYLLASKPVNGRVILDFNLAVNWPCAYTPYATCPVPPMQNRLAVRIEAGEKKYHSDD
jgi:hypothetical protein